MLQTVQRPGVGSAAYGTVHYKELLKSFDKTDLSHFRSKSMLVASTRIDLCLLIFFRGRVVGVM